MEFKKGNIKLSGLFRVLRGKILRGERSVILLIINYIELEK